jgi:hypothetical protein
MSACGLKVLAFIKETIVARPDKDREEDLKMLIVA